jgi:hypothetical protein
MPREKNSELGKKNMKKKRPKENKKLLKCKLPPWGQFHPIHEIL